MKLKRILSLLIVMAMVLSSMGTVAFADVTGNVAKVGNKEYTTLEDAINNANGEPIELLKDVTESITALEKVEFITNVEGGVTVTSTYTEDWVAFNNVTVASGVTMTIPNVFCKTGINIIEGTLNAGTKTNVTTLYHGYDAKTIVQNGGKIIVSGDTVMRYNENADSGIYIYGDGNNETVEYSSGLYSGGYIGAYSGTFYAEDAVVNSGGLRLDYKKNSSEEPDSYAPINAEFVNSKVDVLTELRLYKDANLTLTNSKVTAGKLQVRENAVPTVNIDSESVLKADTVENLTGASINAVLGEDGVVTFKKFVAKIGDKVYETLEDAVAEAQSGDTIILLEDITGNVNINKSIVFDGNSKKVTGKLSVTADGATVKNLNVENSGNTAGYISAKDVQIENCNVTGGNGFRNCYTSGTVTFRDSTITGSTYGIHFDGSAGGEIVIDNCQITGWTSFASTIEHVTMTDTTFNDGNYNYIRFYQDATIEGCTFNEKMRVDVANSVDATVKVTNSTVTNGTVKDLFDSADVDRCEVYVDNTLLVNPVAKIGDKEYTTLEDAVAEAQSGDIILIVENGEYELPLFSNKELTFKGSDKEGVVINDAPDARAQGWIGSTFHFENLTAKGATENYHGLANCVVKVTYKDCNVNGLRFLYATDSVVFENCAFNANGVEHSFWTYGASKVDVINCTFSYADRAVNCYSENGAEHELDISFDGCTFTYTGTAANHEGAVEINSGSVKNISLSMDNCEGTDDETIWFNSQWDSKQGANTVVEIDDKLVWPLVAEVNGVEYADILEAIKAAAPNGTVNILRDITVDKWIMFAESLSISNGNIITLTIDGLTINGNGYSLTVNSIESAGNGARMFYDATNLNINNLTINMADGVSGIGLKSGIIGTVTFNGGVYGVLPQDGDITINNCTFATNGTAIYYEEGRDNLKVTNNTFNQPDDVNVILLRGNTEFTGNTVNSGRTVNVVSGSPVVTGNNFNDVRLKVYNVATATIENNTINNLVFNDETPTKSTFSENTLSKAAEEALDKVTLKVAKIGDTEYKTLEEAFTKAQDGETIALLSDATPTLTSQRAITKATVIDLGGKTLTLTEDDLYFGTTTFKNGTIVVDKSVKPSTAVFWMFDNQTLTFDNVKLIATDVTGTYLIGLDGNNSDLNLINGSEIFVENETALDLDIICVNASTGNDILVENSKVTVKNLDGRVFFRGNYTVSGNSEVNLDGITKAGFRIEAGQTLTISDTANVTITGEPRDGGIHLTDATAVYTKADTATVNATVNKPALPVAKIGDTEYTSVAEALTDANAQGLTDVTITLVGETTKESALSLEDAFNLYTKTQFDSVTFNQEDSSKIYYIDGIYTGKRNNGGYFIFDGVNIIVTGQYIFEGNVKLINNSVVKSVAEANCFIYNGTTTVEPGSKLKGVIDDLRGGTLIVDGGRTDGGYNTEADMQDAIMIINWSGDSITLKNGAYYKANSANEIGRITVNAGANFNVYDSKVDAVEYITVTGTLNTDVNSIITTKTINGAGVITIDAADFTGETVQVINADMSGFTGTVEIINNTKAQYEITDTGIVVSAKAEPVAKIGETEYTSLKEAADAAVSGDTITMIADAAEDVTLPAGIIFDGNDKQVGAITAAGEITFKGYTKATNFSVQYTNTTINIGEGACLELTGTGRLVIGHGCTFNIKGLVADAKTADTANVTPSLIMPGASITGAGVNFNVTNAYIKVPSSYCSSSKSASGTFNFDITNSIWEQAGKLAFEAQSVNATVNFNLKDSVLNTGSHLVFAVTKGEIVFDNSNVNVGTSRQIENRSTLTIKNGSVVNGAVATSSNAKNPGTLIIENATYSVTGEFTGSDVGTGTIVIMDGANFTAGKITNANIQIDATNMSAGDEINLTADLSGLTGTVEVINNDKLVANIVDNKIVLSAKAEPVAKVGDTEYTSLQVAINNANGATVTLIANTAETISIDDDATVVIDLGGNILTGYIAPCDPVSLTVKNGSIVNTNGNYSAIEINSGKLTLENTNIESARHGVRIDGAVEAIINGGEYKLNATSGTRHAVNVSGDATLTIKDGTFIGPKGTTMDSGSAVCVQSGATVIIEDGNFSGGKNATLGVSGIMTIYGGTFDQNPSEYLADGYIARGANGEITTDEYIVCEEDFDIMTVGIYNFPLTLTGEGENQKYRYPVALFGTISNLNYKEAGFIFEYEYNGQVYSNKFGGNSVYTSILVSDEVKQTWNLNSNTITPEWADPENGKYFYGDMINFGEKYKDSTLRYRPYAVLLDGTYVYGRVHTIEKISNK